MQAICGTGVRLRLADDAEAHAVATVVSGQAEDLELHPPRSFVFDLPVRRLEPGDVLVVSQAFAEVPGLPPRVVGMEHHGSAVPSDRDASLELLAIARRTEDDLLDLLADLRIAGHAIGRWDLFSAPRRYELSAELTARLAPLRRG